MRTPQQRYWTRQQRDELSSEDDWHTRKFRQWKIRLLIHKRAVQTNSARVARRQWINSFPESIRIERGYVGFGTRGLYNPPIVTKEDTLILFDPFHPTGGSVVLHQGDEQQWEPCLTCVVYDPETHRWEGTGGACPDHEYI